MNSTPIYRKQDQVFKACENIHARGENVTNEKIMQELLDLGYKKGSNSDITRYKKMWQNNFNYSLEAKESLPKRSDKLEEIIDEIRVKIYEEAKQEFDAFRIETEKNINALNENIQYSQQEIAELRQAKELLLQEQQNSIEKINSLQNENDSLTQLLKDEIISHNNDKNNFASSEARSNAEIENLTEQYKQLALLQQQTLEIHKQELGMLLEQYEQQRHQHIVKIDEGKIKINKLEKTIIEVMHFRDNFEKEAMQAKEELEQVKSKSKILENKIDHIDKSMDENFKNISIQYQNFPIDIKDTFTGIENKIYEKFSKIPDPSQEIKHIGQQFTKLLDHFERHIKNCDKHDTK